MRLIDEKGGVRELATALGQARKALRAYEVLHGIEPLTEAPIEEEPTSFIAGIEEAYQDVCGKLAGVVAQREFLEAAVKTYAPKIWDEIKKAFEDA
jgi:hypothetical protein